MFNTATARAAAAFTILVLNFQELRDNDGEEGQALAEYGLILALIAVICVAALTVLGTRVNDALVSVKEALPV